MRFFGHKIVIIGRSCIFVVSVPDEGEDTIWIDVVKAVDVFVGLDCIATFAPIFQGLKTEFDQLFFIRFSTEVGDHTQTSSLNFLQGVHIAPFIWAPDGRGKFDQRSDKRTVHCYDGGTVTSDCCTADL